MQEMKFWKKTAVLWVLCLASFGTFVSHAETTQDKLDNAANKIDALEQQKQEKEDELDGLESYKSTLSGELGELDNSLYEISTDLKKCEKEIAETDSEIAKKEAAIADMETKAEKQYYDMKKRIKYTYENGQDNLFTILLASSSVTDFLNRSEYATAITEYDRKMLHSYTETLRGINLEKAGLEEARKTLVALKNEAEEKQQSVGLLIAEKKEKISAADGQIEAANDALADYESELKRQRAYEAELEKQKAKEDAARLEEIRKQEQENLSNVVVVPAEGDEALLAAIIECEAGSESYEGKLAVGSVVMNRVASSYFPNTVVGVIYQSGQFSPVASGRFATVLARGAESSCVQAAKEVLAGKRNIGALYFRRDNGLIDGTVIGNHVFY